MNAQSLPLAATLLPQAGHVPVMLAEVLHFLAPADDEAILDCTFGGGGYTRAILDAAACTVWAIDRDPDAIARGNALRAALDSHGQGGRLHMLHGGFGSMTALAQAANAPAFNGIVMDLGVSSFQLDEAERGFSFRHNGPLDMRMEKTGRSAADLVNTATEEELADIIHFYGEERHARRVARAIVTARAQEAFTTTLQLAELVRATVPHDRSGLDGATRTFQGLRIAVNDELGEIERGLTQALDLLAPGGRLVVVSFHSLEDRLVKRAFQRATGRDVSFSRHDPRAAMSHGTESAFKTLAGKAVRPGETECRINPRARSARLRALIRRPDTAPSSVVES